MALAGRLQGSERRAFVVLGDGELHEGQVWEAAMAAAHYRLKTLVAIVDRNDYCLDGRVDDVISPEPLAEKWRAFGWSVHEVDGHGVPELLRCLRSVTEDPNRDRPAVLIAHTVKGKGVSFMEENPGWHLGFLGAEDERRVRRELEAGR
jgi:transketolase